MCTLAGLANELLEHIILYALPEGFESVALTCKRIYTICTPFIEHHNTLRSQFQKFNYYPKDPKRNDPSLTIVCAWDLITRIAVEPLVARYVRHADFEIDSRFILRRHYQFDPDVDCPAAVVKLLADSPYWEQANLDWQEYYAEIVEDLQAIRYSQHAAAFLLTLLPNVETLILPRKWKPISATNKLIDTVVRRAKESHCVPWNTPSLAQTIRFGPSVSLTTQDCFDLAWASPFLALPHMRSFRGHSCIAMDDGGGHKSIHPSKDLSRIAFAETLEAVHLLSCSIDEVGIANFLKHTTRLRTLRYSHSTKDNAGGPPHKDWDICKFVMAIEREVGNHLEELSVSIHDLRGSVTPGQASLRDFQRLRKLELPLEIAMCNMSSAAAARPATTTLNESLHIGDITTEYHELDIDGTFISTLVPASVSQLSLISYGSADHAKALDVMFRHFAAWKEFALPALQEIQLWCPDSADDTYKEQCAMLQAETEKVGVGLYLKRALSNATMTWDGEH